MRKLLIAVLFALPFVALAAPRKPSRSTCRT